jgi:hypothetical protein
MGGRLGGLRDSLTGRKSTAPSGPEPMTARAVSVGSSGTSRVVTVLGMHRSGTSSLVGSLEAAGLPLGEVQTRVAKANQKGHREPSELIALHEDVLISSGGAWHLPPAEVRWSDKQRQRRDAFIASRADLPLWGWKEPRTLLVLDGWLEALPGLEMVATFRHPAVVARSLQRRHGSDSVEMWLELWRAYNTRLLKLVEARGFPIIDFDLPEDGYEARLRSIVTELDLPQAGSMSSFFDGSLRQSQKQAPTDATLPPEVRRTYEQLVGIAAAQAASS